MATGRAHFVFAGGGTGGHVVPGLAVAEELLREDPLARVTFVGRDASLEQQLARDASYDYFAVPSQPLRGVSWSSVRSLCDHVTAYRLAQQQLRDEQASVVIGLGGYVSVPTVRAALSLRVPVVLLEQNAVPGRANSWLSRGARMVCAAFDTVRPHLPGNAPLRITGNPVRRELVERAFEAPARRAGPRRLIVLGGSQGSETLNRQVPRALHKSRARLAGWEIVHQAGRKGADATRELYRKFALPAQVVPMVESMAELLTGADVAISRSGGTALAELAVAGVPTVLVPYPQATDDHQRKNAEIFVAAGAARMVDVRDVVGRVDDALAAALGDLLSDAPERERLSEAMRKRARPDAAENVATLVSELAYPRVSQVAG